MKFGYFDDSRKEYVINTPKTPYPWINYLGNQGFFSLISNTAGLEPAIHLDSIAVCVFTLHPYVTLTVGV